MKTLIRKSARLAALLGILGPLHAAAPEYTVTDLTAPRDELSRGNAINAGGQVTGFTGDRGFRWSPGSGFATPGVFGTQWSVGAAINDAGQIDGYAIDPSIDSSPTAAVIIEPDGSTTTIAPLRGDGLNEAHGINNLGQAVGISTGAVNHAFLRSAAGVLSELPPLAPGQAATANAINDAGVVVGAADIRDAALRHAVRWTQGKVALDAPDDLGVLPGGTYSEAAAINSSGQIVGYSQTALGTGTTEQAFLYDANARPKLRGLGLLLGGGASRANAINDAGHIVGAINSGGLRAFLISDGVTMRDLNTLIPAEAGWFLTEATGINARGQITGYGTTPQGKVHAFLLTPIVATPPEPPRAAPPTVAISGKKKVTTTKARLAIKGSAAGAVTSVTIQIGRKPAKTASGTTAWKFTAPLAPGKNKITVTAHGPGGDSALARLTVIRKP